MTTQWQTIKLNNPDLFESLNGLWKGKKPPFTKAKVIRNTNFTKMGIIDYSNVAELDVEQKQLEKRHLNRGDIIVERSGGSPTQPVGRVVFFDKDDKDFSFSNFTSTIRIKDQKNLFPKYVFYFLKYFYDQGSTEDLQQRTTGLRNLDFNTYKERAEIPFLPFVQQHTIAAILSKIQEAIENQDKIIQTTTELKASLMRKLFSEGLNGEPLKQTEISKIPKSWKTSTIDGSFVVNQGKQLSEKTRRGENQKYFLRTSNVFWGRLNLNDLDRMNFTPEETKRLALEKGDVLVCEGGDIGRTAIWNDEISDCYYQNHLHRLRAKNDSVNPKYFTYWMHYAFVIGKVYFGLGNKTTIPNLSQGKVKSLEFPLPSIKEQGEIAELLSAVDAKIENAKKLTSAKTDLFKSMLSNLMSGEMRVNNITL